MYCCYGLTWDLRVSWSGHHASEASLGIGNVHVFKHKIGVNAKINYVYTWFLYEIENYWEYVCASLYPGVILVGTQVGMVSK